MVDGRAAAILHWYASHARDLPWRRPDAGPWAVLVSEIMLQQTPVSRVLPAYDAWLERWPEPPALAAASPADAVRQWGRLGYPRRALRLHASAKAITQRHGGVVPDTLAAVPRLPGCQRMRMASGGAACQRPAPGAAAHPGIRGHGPAVPRPPASGTTGIRRAGPGGLARRGLGR